MKPRMVVGRRVAGPGPWRVFVSHTSDLRGLPAAPSYVEAAEDAITRAGHVTVDMKFFPAADADPAELCASMVRGADVYAGLIGLRFGAPVRGRPELSHTQLEFEAATSAGLPRLIFLIGDGVASDARQERFRRQLQDAGLTTVSIASPADLELRLYHALVELQRGPSRRSGNDTKNRGVIARALRRRYAPPTAAAVNGEPALELVVEEETGARRSASDIVEIHEDAGNGLLILGDPGAGKSGLLHTLARELLELALHDESRPLPIVLDLSSWGARRLPMSRWLVEELWLQHRINQPLAERWLPEGRLTLLLDGLDQVHQHARSGCIDAINQLHRSWLLAPVVCCRRSTYLAEQRQLTLQSTVLVLPLTDDQVVTCLERLGPPAAAVLESARTDQRFRELLRTPLMLHIAVSSYRDRTTIDLPEMAGPDDLRKALFERYLQRMLYEDPAPRRWSPQRVQRSLTWLASLMRNRNQSLFFLERLQPDWLDARAQRTYRWFGVLGVNFAIGAALAGTVLNLTGATEMPAIFVAFAVVGLTACLLAPPDPTAPPNGSTTARWLGPALARAAFVTVVFSLSQLLYLGSNHGAYTLAVWRDTALLLGPFNGAFMVLLDISIRSGIIAVRSRTRASSGPGFLHVRQITRRDVLNGLVTGALAFGALIGIDLCVLIVLFTGLDPAVAGDPRNIRPAIVLAQLASACSSGLVMAFLSMIMSGRSADVRPVEVVVVSWLDALRQVVGARPGRPALTMGAVAFTLFLLVDLGFGVGLEQAVWVSGAFGVIATLCYLLLGGVYAGLAGEVMADQLRIRPNEGMRRSRLNALSSAFLSAAVGWSASTALPATLGDLPYALSVAHGYALLEGASCGLLGGLIYGGAAYVQHVTIRALLALHGRLPLRAVSLLEEAEGRALLRRSGGGYAFVHDLLRDHLASLADG